MELLQRSLNLLLPNQCLGCHKFLDSNIPLCSTCAKTLSLNFSFYCPACHKRLPYNLLACPSHKNLPLKAIACLFDWRSNLVQDLILNFKYHNLLPLKNVFQIYLTEFFNYQSKPLQDKKYNLISIPLSPQKLRQRGFNQAEIIIPNQEILNLPVIKNNLIRIVNNPPQALTLSPEERLQNMVGAFAIKNDKEILNKNIILIDDVYTTGATLNEAAEVLKRNGTKNIIGVTLAGQIY
jgi:competence protein ComFC